MFIAASEVPNQKKYRKIISLVPSQTELLFDLGLEEEVIGITKFCIHPGKWFKDKIKVGGTKKLNIPLINQLAPDLIIANKEENTKEEIASLSMNFDVYVSNIKNINDATAMIKDIGKLTGKENNAFEMADKIALKFDCLMSNIFSKRKIKTVYMIWKDPYMVAGGDTFINDMMSYCGLDNFYGNHLRYPEIKVNELNDNPGAANSAELILLSSEPYPFKQKHIQKIQPYTPSLKILLADGEMFSWYGSRLLKAADYFTKLRSEIDTLLK